MRATRTRVGVWLGLVLAGILVTPLASAAPDERSLTLEERVAAQRAIERVYWAHRIWPQENPNPRPEFDDVVTDVLLRSRVEDYLRQSNALERLWGRPITGSQLQAELARISADTRSPAVLHEIFAALGNDPRRVAECVARPILAARLLRSWSGVERAARSDGGNVPFESWWARAGDRFGTALAEPSFDYSLPQLSPAACTDDTWASTSSDVPEPRVKHAVVWTGAEMIVWGGGASGSRYDPATDTWRTTSPAGAPTPRSYASGVWTGSEMIVWGGMQGDTLFSSGARYNPSTDSWSSVSDTGSPSSRRLHTAIWTGTEMIVWGGWNDLTNSNLDTGARYNPATNAWTPTTATGAPSARSEHTAVWTGTEMIVWGGSPIVNTGARYRPATDSWTATTLTAAPTARVRHSAVWSGTLMIVWGGQGVSSLLNTGSRYDPTNDRWTATTLTGAPTPRQAHRAVWTGTVMVVWGEYGPSNTGGRYNPQTNKWAATSTVGAPTGRLTPSAVWTGTEMIVWGGDSVSGPTPLNTGGRYSPTSDSWLPTATTGTTPSPRFGHTTVWTGAETIVWGGGRGDSDLTKTGGRYDPATDSWTPTDVSDAPLERKNHTAVWTGSQMIVWGGDNNSIPGGYLDTGGRYDPVANAWTPTAVAGAPSARNGHTALWTGTRMIVWGGQESPVPPNGYLATGGQYDPIADSWSATGASGAPAGRRFHTAVWTGTEMIVWGGYTGSGLPTATGGRYAPATDTWSPTSLFNAPTARGGHASVWTGSTMIVWGGDVGGGRYSPASNSWGQPMASDSLPVRSNLGAVWTGVEMLAWGGSFSAGIDDVGARYNPTLNSWRPMTSYGEPSPRSDVRAVWSSTEMIVWGGGTASSTGGRYCACHVPSALYQDLDGDGFGSPASVVIVCAGSLLPGYVTVSGDCDDANPAIHPGAVEVCNGVDDDCNGAADDGIPLPGAPAMAVSKSGTDANLTWSAAGGATFDVVKGAMGVLRSTGGDFTSSTTACLANDTALTAVSDTEVPVAGDGVWYLVRGANCTGKGSYDGSDPAQQGSRDAEIAASPNVCP